MNFVDVIIILCLVFGALLGFKKGIIKTLVQLVGSIVILILAYSLKDILANWLMSFMPFFNFAGLFEGITSVNIIVYQVISFVVIYVILYCILGILINISGIIERLLKMTIVLAIPSKILGAIVGAIEGLVFAFLIVFIMFNLSLTTKFVNESKTGVILLERMPVIGGMAAKTTLSLKEINKEIKKFDNSKTKEELNKDVLSILIKYEVISDTQANELIEAEKINLPNIKFE